MTWEDCPIATSLRFLGRKWTLTVLRDIAFFPRAGFGLIRQRNPGIRPRVLSTRLRQLAAEGLVERVADPERPRHPYYRLSARGSEIWPILSALFNYGTRHHADAVFPDHRARGLGEVYPDDAALLMGSLREYARAEGSVSSRGSARFERGDPRSSGSPRVGARAGR